jgi:hypothetical protein
MNLNVTEIDNSDNECEDIGIVDNMGNFTATPSSTSRVPLPRITTMAHKNRGSLAPPPTPAKPQRKVTYDDILSSLNMKVVNGNLQIVRNINEENMKSNNFPQQQQQKKFVQMNQQQQTQQTQQYPQQHLQQTQQYPQQYLQQTQNFQQQESLPSIPIMTKEQYKQMQKENYIKAVQQQQYIRNVKSTKLKFSNNNNTNINISPVMRNTNDLNRLFPLKGLGDR